jgi:hypothetical protein
MYIGRGKGKVIKTCVFCNNEFLARHDRKGVYCSKSCNAKNQPKKITRIKFRCKICNNEFEVKKYRENSASFCSIKCMSIERGIKMRRENHPSWKGGISERPYKVRKLIESLKKKIGKCQVCFSENNLQGHHIQPFSLRPDLGDDENNILILCGSCHSKEHPELSNFITGVQHGR